LINQSLFNKIKEALLISIFILSKAIKAIPLTCLQAVLVLLAFFLLVDPYLILLDYEDSNNL